MICLHLSIKLQYLASFVTCDLSAHDGRVLATQPSSPLVLALATVAGFTQQAVCPPNWGRLVDLSRAKLLGIQPQLGASRVVSLHSKQPLLGTLLSLLGGLLRFEIPISFPSHFYHFLEASSNAQNIRSILSQSLVYYC